MQSTTKAGAAALCTLLFAVFSGGVGGAWAAGAADEVRALDAKRFQAMVKADTAALGKLLADDLTYVHSTGETETKKTFLEALTPNDLDYEALTPSDVKVRVFGETAVVTGRAAVKAKVGGRPLSFSLCFTDVWVRRNGSWQMVAWQSTRLP